MTSVSCLLELVAKQALSASDYVSIALVGAPIYRILS